MPTSKIKTLMAAPAFLLTALLSACTEEAGEAGGPAGGGELARVTVATGPAGTLYNQLGVAVTTATQRELGIPATARPFTGSSVYLPRINRGEMEFGVNLSVDLQASYGGVDPYPRAMDNLRAGMLLTRAPFQYYVRGNSDVETMADLRGRPVVTSFRSLATFERVNAAVLGTAGIGFEDVDQVEVAGVPDAIRALVENRADAAGTILGIPALREADATLSGGIRVLDLGPDEDALSAVPGLGATMAQPGPAYVGIERPTRIAQFDVYLSTGTHLSDDQVYRIIGTLHRNWTGMQEEQAALGRIGADELVPEELIVPFHEGAVRYFREAGLWTEDHDRQQRELLGTP